MNKIPYIILYICFISMTILAYKNNEVIKLQNEQIYIYQQKNIDNIIGSTRVCDGYDKQKYQIKILQVMDRGDGVLQYGNYKGRYLNCK